MTLQSIRFFVSSHDFELKKIQIYYFIFGNLFFFYEIMKKSQN